MGTSGGEQPPRVLRALEALKKAAAQLHVQAAAEAAAGPLDDSAAAAAAGGDACGSLSMRALLELERQSEGLLGHDPDLEPLLRLLSRLRAVAAAAAATGGSRSPRPRRAPSIAASLASLLRLGGGGEGDAESEEVAQVAAGIEEEIQAWIDRENTYGIASALRALLTPRAATAAVLSACTAEEAECADGDDENEKEEEPWDEDVDESAVASLLSAMESRLARGFDARYQSALLRSGAFPALLAALAPPAPSPSASSPPPPSKLVRESCASAVAAAVRFNPAVFVGPVLSCSSPASSVVRSLAGMATPAAARALGALVSAIRTPLVDEMEARGEIPLLVGLLRKPADLAAAAMGAAMGVGSHGRREAVQAMVEAGAVERLVGLELEYGADEEGDDEGTDGKTEMGVRAGAVGIINQDYHSGAEPGSSCRVFQGCVARFAVCVGTGLGMGRRDKGAVRAELVRRVRAAAEADARAGNILAEVLWDIT